jgi:hypothetical protein
MADETGGDWSYDAVHEAMSTLRVPAVPVPRVPQGLPARVLDLDGDLGYDSAHEG